MAQVHSGESAEILVLKVHNRLPVRDLEALCFAVVAAQLEPGVGTGRAAQLLARVDDQAVEDARFVEGVGEGEVVDGVERQEMTHQLLGLLTRAEKCVRFVEFVDKSLKEREKKSEFITALHIRIISVSPG